MSEVYLSQLDPSEYDFDTYVHKACYQLNIFTTINITRIQQSENVDKKTNRTPSKSIKINKNEMCLLRKKSSDNDRGTNTEICDLVKITTVYDQKDKLVELKFMNNKNISLPILKVIRLIIKFQTNLTNVIINKGLSKAGLREISKWLELTNITNLCLDNVVIENGNYESVLEKGCLKILSLSRCEIDDGVLKRIASKLTYPLPASKNLTMLKLTSNRITDAGAKHLAEMLRTNRQLAYLNLSDNNIADDGFVAILDVLQEFPIREDERLAMKSRYVTYLKKKNKVIGEIMAEILAGNFENISMKSVKSFKNSTKSASETTNILTKELKARKTSMTTADEKTSQLSTISLEDKVKTLAEHKIDKFIDPFSPQNIQYKDDQGYCYGNNGLAYINLSYNEISYVSVKKLWNVLLKQKMLDRKPRGLVNLSIDGNCLPKSCVEMINICEILNESLALGSGRQARKKSRILKSESCIGIPI